MKMKPKFEFVNGSLWEEKKRFLLPGIVMWQLQGAGRPVWPRQLLQPERGQIRYWLRVSHF